MAERLFLRHPRGTDQTVLEDLVPRQDILIFLHELRKHLQELFAFLHEPGRQIGADAADADIVERHARTADEVEQVEYLLPVAERVNHARDRAQIVGQRPDENKMAGDAVQLRHDHADIFGALRHLDLRQFLHRAAITEIVVHRGNIIKPIRIRDALDICTRFQQLLDTAVQIAHAGSSFQDILAVQVEPHLQHAVGRRMLRSHAERISFRFRHTTAPPSVSAAHAAA